MERARTINIERTSLDTISLLLYQYFQDTKALLIELLGDTHRLYLKKTLDGKGYVMPKNVKCSICHRRGHSASECPKNPNNKSQGETYAEKRKNPNEQKKARNQDEPRQNNY